MPYSSMKDINPALKGIKPAITLAQANLIAGWADKIEGADDPWAVAIANFKKAYESKGGKWTEKKAKESDVQPSEHRKAVELAFAAGMQRQAGRLTREQAETALAEAENGLVSLIDAIVAEAKEGGKVMKTVDGVKYPASDFLVVEDPNEPSKWHLQVKRNGKPDHNLMGAARGALTDPNYRGGKPYSGPNKAEALKKLKALYTGEKMKWRESDQSALEGEVFAEMMDDWIGDSSYVPMGVTSFKDLFAAREMEHTARQITTLTEMLMRMIWGVAVLSESSPNDKVAGLRALMEEYIGLFNEQVGSISGGEEEVDETPEGEEDLGGSQAAMENDALHEMDFHVETAIEGISEGDFGSDILALLAEVEAAPGAGRRAPVVVDLRIIKPGPGNTHDGHYYPGDMLRQYAPVFEGADVFVVEHDDAKRGERTKVGRIRECPVRFDEGGPVGRTIVYDPDEAEKIRNRADAGELGTLHCSIYASGMVREGQVGGTKYKIVESIGPHPIVDLVSRHGAGGQALNLVESQSGGTAMLEKDKVKQVLAESADLTDEVRARLEEAEYKDEAELREAILREASAGDGDGKQKESETQEPQRLTEAQVQEIVNGSNLPAGLRPIVTSGVYENEEALNKAVESAISAVKAAGSGQAHGQGDTSQAVVSEAAKLAEYQKELDRAYVARCQKFGLSVQAAPAEA